MKFRALIEQDEDGVFVAQVPTLPGCISQGHTRGEALDNIREAITAYLESLEKHGEPVPPAITEELVEVARVSKTPSGVVESCGREQVRERDEETDDPAVGILHSYLAAEISLGKAAELLALSRFELQERFHRLGIPLRLGPATLEEARAEVAAALKVD